MSQQGFSKKEKAAMWLTYKVFDTVSMGWLSDVTSMISDKGSNASIFEWAHNTPKGQQSLDNAIEHVAASVPQMGGKLNEAVSVPKMGGKVETSLASVPKMDNPQANVADKDLVVTTAGATSQEVTNPQKGGSAAHGSDIEGDMSQSASDDVQTQTRKDLFRSRMLLALEDLDTEHAKQTGIELKKPGEPTLGEEDSSLIGDLIDIVVDVLPEDDKALDEIIEKNKDAAKEVSAEQAPTQFLKGMISDANAKADEIRANALAQGQEQAPAQAQPLGGNSSSQTPNSQTVGDSSRDPVVQKAVDDMRGNNKFHETTNKTGVRAKATPQQAQALAAAERAKKNEGAPSLDKNGAR